MPTQPPIQWVGGDLSRGGGGDKTVGHERLTTRLLSGGKPQRHLRALTVCMDTAHYYDTTDISFTRIQFR